MTAKASTAIAAAIVIAALLLPAVAAAGPRASRHGNPEVFETMRVWGTNGYGFEISLVNRQRLTVFGSSTAGPGLILANYSLKAPQPAGSKSIQASLGKLGRIDVRFHRTSIKERKPSHPVCQGEKTKVEYGRFFGAIEFHGEGGYTDLQKTRSLGAVEIEPPPSCLNKSKHPKKRHPDRRPSAGAAPLLRLMDKKSQEAPEEEAHLLVLKAKTENPPVTFAASQLIPPKKLAKKFEFGTFAASATRDRGRIQEEVSALDLLVKGSYFTVPDLTHPTQETTVQPPAPFLGSATFRRESADKVSWAGDLRVNLPGFGVVSLAGPGTEASLCADSGCPVPK